jgi:sigma-B regulation protein RsbQ
MTTENALSPAPADVMLRHHVTVTGRADGPVLLFAHGFGCDQHMWRRIIPYFTDQYRVVLFDHMGSGSSDQAAYDADRYSSLDGYVADILVLCEAMDLQEVTLVAHSVATMMALLAAVAEPERFARLVLVAPSPSYIDEPAEGYVGGFTRTDIDDLLESLDSNYFAWSAAVAPMVMGNSTTPELGAELATSFCRTNPDTARNFARVSFLSDVRESLASVRVPALILQCSDDMLAPLEIGRYLQHALAGSELVELRASGHVPQASAPKETATAILEYLKRQW